MEECCYEFGLSCSLPGYPLLAADRGDTFLPQYYSSQSIFTILLLPSAPFRYAWCSFVQGKLGIGERVIAEQSPNREGVRAAFCCSKLLSAAVHKGPQVNGEWMKHRSGMTSARHMHFQHRLGS